MIKKIFTFFLLAILAMVGYAFFTGILSNTFFRLPAITLGGITFFAVIGLIFGFLVYGKHKVRPFTKAEWEWYDERFSIRYSHLPTNIHYDD